MSAVASQTPAKQRVESFDVVGMNVMVVQILDSIWVFTMVRLTLVALASMFVSLRALVFHAHFASPQNVFRMIALAGTQCLLAQLKQQVAITAFAIGQQSQVTGSVDNLRQQSHRFLEQCAFLLPACQLPDNWCIPRHPRLLA